MNFNEILQGKYTPFVYLDRKAETGFRIGGNSPVDPAFKSDKQRYFGTLDFESDFGVSIFYSFDVRGVDVTRDIIDYNNRLLFPSELIHVVVHKSKSTCKMDGLSISDVSNHAMKFGECVAESALEAYPESKIGGRPFVDNESICGLAFATAESQGFHQIAQFHTPNPRTVPFVKQFPWDPGWLHVFYKGTEIAMDNFAFVIQQ